MGNVLKKAIIRYKTRDNIKSRSLRQSVTYDQSKTIAICYSDQFGKLDTLERLIHQLQLDGKQVSRMVFCHYPKKGCTSHPYFTSKNISFYGQIKKEEVSSFLQENYDFALCFDESNHYIINYIFSLIRAKCRVGVMHPDRKNLFELMVIADKKGADLSNEVLRYLKMIKTYEH